MRVVFDSSFLIRLFDARYGIEEKREVLEPRFEYLIRSLETMRTQILVPTPALSELLIGAGEAAPEYLRIMNVSARFKIVPFGLKAAVEAAAAHREALRAGDKREGAPTWAKVKFDRQILSIAIVERADRIYSNDRDIHRLAEPLPIEVISFSELPDAQPFDEPRTSAPQPMSDLFEKPVEE